ncbi:hypothetical protein L211DRAFT_832124 [Terfezia boudieri ATCC MYA-4762]|uniref:Uncharacterized protein n=1 Tax=Terfezia boudieri ATCC MYA-4762 TaxID=1051890 RepID=A0A3N4M2Z9_9PEZI|nr:hypothetical protein L211DRAFT_832124 [Terfezia boudieri ATCC MYA-4762]
MPISRILTQRNAAAVFLLSTAGVLYIMNKPTRFRAPTTTTGTGAQGTYQIPSFALGGCERSGGGV